MNILNTKEQNFLKIINATLSDNSLLGDDCAYLREFNFVISQDTLVENVHFDLDFIKPYELGKKAAIVNLSDISASGAFPLYLTISLSGNFGDDFIKEFYKGINEICASYNVKIAGGDLTFGDKITISICALGSAKNRNISSRKNSKEGYIVAVAGDFGSSAYYLKTKEEKYKKAHIEPELHFEISNQIATKAKKPYAMTDSSDGLLDCLAQISSASKTGIEIEYEKIPKTVNDKDFVLWGGEDYCLVACLAKSDFSRIKGLKKIGTVIAQKGIFVDNEDYSKKNWKGFKHFD